ncbi:hypothetical protein COU13_01210 [Candidatus Kaiserbacteria bacterium CG10_big_fil_rev_8_21_14_0_10_43_70]|uniref:Uncharacterized protein n=1 Tax=Candidatus Kaiserbacteria bacterium CG10_big_fil_rev_8_21_14_0_10_43_70 TaxID=1974605 RepID=A0A2H0UJ17_9BACT|nr:MAG: hypothetical protein COU13_01210 [Candidatus Kaiserbacteria bacterium CG10_big_fil_rev_8_21_14_0_10_43_70]
MEPSAKEERRRLAAEDAREQLADGTWPQVMVVYGYTNPSAPRVPDEEFTRLKALYEQAACPNVATFIELVRFVEKEHGVTMSFNLSLRRRLVPGEVPETTTENARLYFSCPDILVGTRGGVEGAMVWFKNFYEAIGIVPSESAQVMDKIFGEAVEFLKGPSRETNNEEMFKSVVSGECDVLHPPKVSKH